MPREAGLLQALAATDRLGDLLPVLYQHAVSAVEGRGSILFQFSRGNHALHATSAYGIEHLPPDPWPARQVPRALFRDGSPLFVSDLPSIARNLSEYLDALAATLVPLTYVGAPLGVLVIGSPHPPTPDQLRELAPAGHAFVIALERTRVAGEWDLQLQLRDLLQDFARHVASKPMAAGLEALCKGANRLFGADRTSVWLHDRRAREVVLSASSDSTYLERALRCSTSDALAPAAIGLRREHAEIAQHSAAGGGRTGTLTVPLKGRRRALGTLVVEEVRLEPGSEIALLARGDEMGRQLASAIETVLLLDAVLRTRRELEDAFNSLADPVAVSGQDGQLAYVNRAFLTRSGRPRHDLIERPMAEFVGPETREMIARASPGDHTRQSLSAQVEDPVLGGTFLVTLTPLLGEEGTPAGVVLVARDITPHARIEAERADLRSRLAQSEKLAALGRVVAGIAHELNNPLQGVLGHLELLRTTGAFPKTLRRDVQRIYREADRAARIVRNLLLFAGSRPLVRRRISVNATLLRVLALRAPACRAVGIQVVRRHEDRLPRVKGDPLLLQQALLNIVLNAEQAIGGDGGRIETQTTLLAEGSSRHVVVRIRDTGPGITPAAMSRLFEPFYTTKDVGGGTGLGLAIAYGIIQDHRGQIAAANAPDGGAVFTVQLPVEPE